ncbi:MAG TPA: glycosyltransferase family 39 protein [Burkholderiaceae bacterium]|nr:glycosyltransferase family 39 protein [Burkholderiaceae bacterium]
MSAIANQPLHPAASRALGASRWLLAITALCVMLVWFGTLDARHLLPTDEGRYAEIAREMFASGDWVTIRYNGLKYFEKPPFHLWMTALAYEAFGVGEWQARLWGALSGAVGMALTVLVAFRYRGPRVALLAGLVLLASPYWNIGSHLNTLDSSLSGALTAALAGLLLAQHPSSDASARRRWMWFAWGAMAVAVLTKGLIGVVLPGLTLIVYSLWTRDFGPWRRLHIASGLLLFLAITVPWFWLVMQRNPEFARFFFVHEHFERYTSSVHHRIGPWWYFVPLLLFAFLPWTGLWLRIVAYVRRSPRGPDLQVDRLLAAWAISIFVFFSLSGSKLPLYIQPMMPALALLGAAALSELQPAAWGRNLTGAAVVCAAAAAAAPHIGRLATDSTPRELLRAYEPWLISASVLMLVGTLLAVALNRRGRQSSSIVLYALSIFAGTTVALVGHETLGRARSGIDLVPAMQSRLEPQMPLYGVKLLDHTLPFYLRHTLTMVESPDELEFGTRQEPAKWLPTMAAFRQRWVDGTPALALMRPDTYAQLEQQGLPMIEIGRDTRRVVVANFRSAP